MYARQQGFTLIEMLLSVAILTMVAGMSLPLFQVMQNSNDLNITVQGVAQALRRAQLYSRGAQGDVQWSVEVQSSAVTLFRGTNFGARDASYDEVITVPAGVSVGGLSEVQFTKMTGAPNTTGNITFTSTRTNEVKTVNINAKGMVQY